MELYCCVENVYLFISCRLLGVEPVTSLFIPPLARLSRQWCFHCATVPLGGKELWWVIRGWLFCLVVGGWPEERGLRKRGEPEDGGVARV